MTPSRTNAGNSPWHTQTVETVSTVLDVQTERGLASSTVTQRRQRYGKNVLRQQPPRSLWRLFADQFADFMILVLIAAAVLAGLMGDIKDTIAIVVIVVLNAAIGCAQELRAQNAIAALRKMAGTLAQVRRDGQPRTLPAEDVVPGDIVMLEAGQIVAADLRLFDAARLRLDESVLTGEAVPTDKLSAALPGAELALGDRRNMAFKGTTVVYGRGAGIAVATGMHSELGRIADLLASAENPVTPLQKRLATFGKRLAIAILALCCVLFIAGLLRGEPAQLMLLTALSLAVAAIPEALPAVVTIALALGAHRMVAQNALVRRLPAVETLGSVTCICSDKTGTLTENRMHVVDLRTLSDARSDLRALPDTAPWRSLMSALALSNDANRSDDGQLVGDPTEIALFNAARAAGRDKNLLSQSARRVFELPFDSDRKRMSTFHLQDDGIIAYTKGAPESVLARCRSALQDSGPVALDPSSVLNIADSMAQAGLRVLAVAQRHWQTLPSTQDAEAIETDLVFIGLVGLLDPARPEARDAIALCRTAGIRPIMITGDHPDTAHAVARQLGMSADRARLMTGPQLAAINDEELSARVASIDVFARVDPAQKIRIVAALQGRGECVAMTGDGVNDAPALKRADIGVAMGRGGTDVAREAAALVLLDDNFATIVKAVAEGRRIFDNIRKFIRYAMTGNAAEIWTLSLAPLFGLPMPLLPIHLLWINLMTDGLPGLALSAEPAERGIMRRGPRPSGESLFAHGNWQSILWIGLLMAALSLGAQAWSIQDGNAHWQTMVFTVLTLSQMALVLAIRAERDSLFKHGLFTNRPLIGAVLLSFLLQMAVIYVPPLNPIFNTAPLSLTELLICLGLSALVFVAVELEKLWRRQRRRHRRA